MNKSRLGLVSAAALLLAGCLSREHKELDIEQRQAKLAEMDSAISYLETGPELGKDFGGKIFISSDTWNKFLAGLDQYQIPLDSPKNSRIIFEKTRLKFLDGGSEVQIEALARHDKWPVEIRVRLFADLVINPNPEEGKLIVSFRVRRVLPDISLSIFRLREYIFAQRLMRIEAQKLVDTLPIIEVPLKPEFRIDLPSRSESWVDAGKGKIKLRIENPSVNLGYAYLPANVLMLSDGLHIFLTLSEGKK